MAFTHGNRTRVYIGGYDLTEYLNSVTVASEADTVEVTTFNKVAKAYIAGMRDATISAEGLFDGNPNAVQDVLSNALGSNTVWVVLPQGDGFGNDGFACQAVETSYEVTVPVDGAVTVSAEAQSVVGLEPVETLHALSAESAGGNGSSLDNGSATTDGGSAYLIVTTVPESAVTVTVQHSADNSTWTTLAEFAATSSCSSQRVEFSGTVNRYTRVIWDQPCTFWAGIYRRR